MRIRFFTWQVWIGFLICVVALLSYPLFFVRFPVTRDFPWANLFLYCVATVFLIVGLRRAFGVAGTRRRRILGFVLTTLSLLVFGLFCFVVFIFPRQLPPSSAAPQAGQKAPAFSLTDTAGRTVTLTELLSTPLSGKPPNGVLLIFYRGYW